MGLRPGGSSGPAGLVAARSRRALRRGWPGRAPPELGGSTRGRSSSSSTSKSSSERACRERRTRRAVASSRRRSGHGSPEQVQSGYGADPARREGGLPRHERAGRRQRPRRARHARRAARRPFVLYGQKVWTSGANYADFCFLFCRIDPERRAPRDQRGAGRDGPPRRPGEPLPEIVVRDHPRPHEVFFSEVEVPAASSSGVLTDAGDGERLARARARHGVAQRGAGPPGVRSRGRPRARRAGSPGSGPTSAPCTPTRSCAPGRRAAARCLGYRGFAGSAARRHTRPEQALDEAAESEASQRVMLPAAELEGARGLDARRSSAPSRSGRRSSITSSPSAARGGLVRDPAQHHRREGARLPRG